MSSEPGIADGRLDAAAAVASLQARGAERREPVRWRQIEALARRASAHEGAVRQRLDARLCQLIDACNQALRVPQAPVAPPPARRPLAELLSQVSVPTDAPPSGLSAHLDGMPSARAADLKAVRYYRSTWSRLSVDQRLKQAQATVHENAGPLNTQRLVHEALTALREASPEYLHHFMSHVEALLWLDRSSLPAGGTRPKGAPGRRAR